MEPIGVNKILVEKYGYEWVNGKAWRPGTAPEPELIDEEESVIETTPEPSQSVTTPETDPVPSEPISLEEKIEQLQASINELQKKYEEALEKLEQANARIVELEGQQGETSSEGSNPDEVPIEPDETPSPDPQQPAVEEEVDASTSEAPEVSEPEQTPAPSYPEPTGVDKILVETYGYEWVNGKAWRPGTAPEPEVIQVKDQTLIGTEGDDILTGGAGNDTLDGGAGGNESPAVAPRLSAVITSAPSGDETIDMMTTGSYYRSSATSPISYGLTDGHYGEQWEDPKAVAAVLQDVMAEFGQYADINLQYAGKYDSPNAATSAGASVVLTFDKFLFEALGSDDVWHQFYPNATDDGNAGVDQIGGDLYLNFNASAWNASSQAVFESRITDTDFGFAALMHGMLGTVGIKSTYNEADGHPSIENTKWAGDADDYRISASNISYDSFVGDFGATLGILDILALMHLYGPNPTTNIGDTEYKLSDINEYFVIYDSGGEDTVSFEDTDRDIDIAMPALKITETFINVEDLKIGAVIISACTTQQVSGFGIGDLENVKTGSGDDVIYTNTLDNTVHAGAGDDTIILSAGSDVIYGGSGADTFLTEAIVFGGYQVGTNTIIKDFEIGIDTIDLPFAPDEDVYSRNEDWFATYTNSAGVNVVLEGIEANVLLIA